MRQSNRNLDMMTHRGHTMSGNEFKGFVVGTIIMFGTLLYFAVVHS